MSAPLTLADAQAVIAAAAHRADEVGQPVNIAVVDAGGNLIAHVRQDEAWIGSIDISINKAWTARAFNTSTSELGANSQPAQQFFGIHTTNSGRVTIFAGGLPLTRDDVVVGGIGVSGGSGEEDQSIAEAGAAALSARSFV
ncbi:heme-binding protein [Mycolicibacterium sp. CBMA 226]|uniref:GlcG/HbpS family heme-binding protein n=1 Tax=Mycolicibacterium sp. CBMA 226 TaxID=2606611 RepID=UPI0012DE98F4|nr:heme-binding protein [Mycolicibacterium sp. CBMA 226]MUL74561.1 heme-binding protein [Mycolicibacterium sp. CBMA 226]